MNGYGSFGGISFLPAGWVDCSASSWQATLTQETC